MMMWLKIKIIGLKIKKYWDEIQNDDDKIKMIKKIKKKSWNQKT